MPVPLVGLAAFAARSLGARALPAIARAGRVLIPKKAVIRRAVIGGAAFETARVGAGRVLTPRRAPSTMPVRLGSQAAGGAGSAMGALVGGQIIGQEPGIIIVQAPSGNILRIKRRKRKRHHHHRRARDRGLSDKDIERILLLNQALGGQA